MNYIKLFYRSTIIRNYGFSLILISAIIIGALAGLGLKQKAVLLKPLGDLFLNMLFVTVVPLVFFSLSSAIANMTNTRRLGNILLLMLIIFAATGLISSLFMLAGLAIFKPVLGYSAAWPLAFQPTQTGFATQLVNALTVPDFVDLLTKKNLLALMFFALLTGLATAHSGEKGQSLARLLEAVNTVLMRVIGYIMYLAPLGLGAYFAYLTGVFGPQLFGPFFQALMLYYPAALLYFFLAFTGYAWLAGRGQGVKTFWTNIIPPALTALGTGSSIATIPSNLAAADRSGIPKDVSEVVIPIGATMHMDGSCMAAMLKIALLFGLFQIPFFNFSSLFLALGIALLSGLVMSGIPGGGMTGEILIISLYGFPMEALPIISLLGTLVDPPATMINAVGDNVASMLIARLLGGKNWQTKPVS